MGANAQWRLQSLELKEGERDTLTFLSQDNSWILLSSENFTKYQAKPWA